MIGHSVGELGCAYADDCFTSEQMILAAYYRGKVSNDTNLEPGYMASVGEFYIFNYFIFRKVILIRFYSFHQNMLTRRFRTATRTIAIVITA